MRQQAYKKRFVIDGYSTNSGRWFLYDNGVIIGRVIRSGQTHVVSLSNVVGVGDLSAADLSDLLCMIRELDSLYGPTATNTPQ